MFPKLIAVWQSPYFLRHLRKAKMMMKIIQLLLIAFAAFIFLSFIWATFVSYKENEQRAGSKFLFLALLLPIPYLLIAFIDFQYQFESGVLLLVSSILLPVILYIPNGNKTTYRHAVPKGRIDERDTMFSRNELKPGTDDYEKYYRNNPDKKPLDDIFRSNPGLLKPGSSQYHPFHFASADASFEAIAALKDNVNGPVNPNQTIADATGFTNYIKNWSKKLGALDCGITRLKDYHIYSVGGRKERRNRPVNNHHKYALAFTVEMNKTMMDSAPSGSIVMESAQQYLESGKIALQVAAFIRNLGYEARAHIDGNYEVVCPLVARDAGLGEIGRMGLLMTPSLGPRVRISVVTTDIPLIIDDASYDYSMIDFCEKCKKCADACPSKAISFEHRNEINGVKRWQINQEACFTLWCQLGTDCGRCMSVCPYSHPDNLLHNIVRSGLKRSSLFRAAALKMDDAFYGRKPASSPLPDWLDIKQKT